MVYIKPQFSGLLSSITIALAVGSATVDALPHSPRRPGTSSPTTSPIEVEFPELATRAPLMHRGGGGSGSSRARMMRQLEAAQLFEASRFAQARMRRKQPMQDLPRTPNQARANGRNPPSSRQQLDTRSTKISHEPRRVPSRELDADVQGPHIARHLETTVTPNGPIPTPHNNDEPHLEPHKRRHYHHHAERPNDHSKGGHSNHWFEHHAHDSDHPHHHDHHHNHRPRGSRGGPSRLLLERRSGSENEFIAPASVRVKAGQGKAKTGKPSASGPSRMVKKPKSKNKAHVESGGDREGSGSEDEEWRGKKKQQGAKDKWDRAVRRDASLNGTQSGLESESSSSNPHAINGIPGVLDLMSHSAGAKLGGLSVATLSSSAFASSANGTALHNATALEYLIDSTPNPTEQTTFYLREFDDQSLIHSEKSSPTPVTTQAVQDLLVSLEVPVSAGSNSTGTVQRMCATFNPQAREVQMFGLSLCMDEHGAKNDGSASQAFRFSPGSGVVQPFYAVGGAGDRTLEMVNERIFEQMDAEATADGGAEMVDSNSTTALPDLAPVIIASSINVNSTTTIDSLFRTKVYPTDLQTRLQHQVQLSSRILIRVGGEGEPTALASELGFPEKLTVSTF